MYCIVVAKTSLPEPTATQLYDIEKPGAQNIYLGDIKEKIYD